MKNKMFKCIVIFVLLIPCLSYSIEKIIFNYFEKGNYNKVISHFENKDKNIMSSTEFNLIGSSFFRKGNIANAKFNYFLGLKKDPYNAELLSNFNLTSEATYENSEERKKHLLLVLVFILLVAFNLSFFLFPILRRKKAFIILYTFLLGFSFYFKNNTTDLNNFIVIHEKKQLKSGIDPDAIVFEEIFEGEIYYILDKIGDHLKIRGTLDGKVGWVKVSS